MKNIPDHIIFFDGECVLCNRFIRFVLRKDKKNIFHLSYLQSSIGKKIQEQLAVPANTVIYVEKGKTFTKSVAVLKIFRHLGGIYRFFYPFVFLPSFLREPIYMLISKYRYRWFGKYDTCPVPDANLRKRFLATSLRA